MKLPFAETYLGKLRSQVGSRLLQVPGFRIIIQNSESKILLVKRRDFDLWGLPAGSPEVGESIEDCIRREVAEETGLSVKGFSCFGFASNPEAEINSYPNGDAIHSYSLLVFSNEFEGSPAVSDDEMSEVVFFSYDNLPDPKTILRNEFNSILLFQEFTKSGQFQWS